MIKKKKLKEYLCKHLHVLSCTQLNINVIVIINNKKNVHSKQKCYEYYTYC